MCQILLMLDKSHAQGNMKKSTPTKIEFNSHRLKQCVPNSRQGPGDAKDRSYGFCHLGLESKRGERNTHKYHRKNGRNYERREKPGRRVTKS